MYLDKYKIETINSDFKIKKDIIAFDIKSTKLFGLGFQSTKMKR